MATVRLFSEPSASAAGGAQTVVDGGITPAEPPKSLADIAQSEQIMRERDRFMHQSGVEMAKLQALHDVSEHYSTLLDKIGRGEDVGDIGMSAEEQAGIRKSMFKTENGKTTYSGKVPLADLGVFLGVRNGLIEPNDRNLPFIIQSMTAVASNGNVLGDYDGKRFMQFQSRFDKRNHKVKEGVDSNTDTAIKDRTWTPEATFEALQNHFDALEETQATRMMMFNKRLLAESCGLNAGEDYFKLDHDRQLEIANNLSGLFDRKWLTTRIDAALQRTFSNEYEDINKIDGGDVLFDRLMNGVGFPDNVNKYVGGFLDAVQKGEYYRSREEFAKYLYENGFEHTAQYLQGPSHFGSFGTLASTTYTDKEISDGDETLKAVKNDDGTYSLMVKRGGRIDREVNFKNEVLGAYSDEDGRYAAMKAIEALNQNPEAWTIVNRAIDKQGAAIVSNGMDAGELLKDLLSFYDKEDTKEWHEHAREVANAVVSAVGALDTEVGAMYAESGIGRTVAGALNILLQFGATTTEYFRDDDFTEVATEFASRHSNADKDEAFAYLESMRSAAYNLTTKRIFDDGTLVGGAAQFWVDIYGLGKVFELGQMGLGLAIELGGRGAYASAEAMSLGNRAASVALATQRFGRAMQGVKNMRLVNELNDFNKSVREVRKMTDMSLVEKATRISEMHETFLAKVAAKYGGDRMVEINKYVDALAKFVGKIPALGAMYNSDTDNAYLAALQDTTVLDDKEFTQEERDALMNYSRAKGGVTAVMMAGLLHVFPKGFKKIMNAAKGDLGMEADALDRMFLAICKGQEGLSTLTPENQFLFRACVSTAMSRASKEAAMNGAFMFTLNEANTIIDNNRRIWERQMLDPNFKPTVYDMLRGSGDALWEGGKAAVTAGLPMAAIGGVGGVRAARGRVNEIRNTRYGLAEKEIAKAGEMGENDASIVIAKALLGLEQARRDGDKKAENAIFEDIRKVGGARSAQFMRQLDYAIRKNHGDKNIGYRTQLEHMVGQDFSTEGLKKTLERVGLSHSTVEDIGDGKMLVTIGKGDIDAMVSDGSGKPIKIVVSHSTVPVRDASGAWSKSFVKSVVQMLDNGELAGRVKEIWDAMSPKQKRRAMGANESGDIVSNPRNTNGIWAEAERIMTDSGMMRGVFLESKDAKGAGKMSNEEANLYDGLVVLSQGSRRYEEEQGRVTQALRSLENIRKMAANATGNGGASVETFIHEMFHAITELLPLDANLREDLKKVYGGKARGGDWRENFVDDFIRNYKIGETDRRQMDEAELERMSLFDRVSSAASRLLRGLFGRDVKPEERVAEDGIKEFVNDAIKTAPDEAKTMREIEEMERNIESHVNEMLPQEGEGGLFDFGKERQRLLDGYDVDGAVGAAIEIEREVANGERGYYIVGRGTEAGRRAVALSNLSDGRNLLVGAHVVANRFGTLEVSEPQYENERSRRAEINAEITAYAKRQRAYTGNVEASFKKMGATYLASGSEADVYLSRDKNFVYKAITPDTLYDGDMRLMLDRIALHNYVSPDAPLKIIGFGMHKGALNVIVKQPYFEAGSLDTLTQKGLYAAMEDAGFKRVSGAHITDHGQEGEEVWMSRDKRFVIGDLAARNVSISGSTLRIIDCAAYKNVPWLRDRANIPEKLRPRGQQTYEEVKQAMRERETSAMVEFYENMGLTHEDAVKKAGGLFQIVGAHGLEEMCGDTITRKVLSDVSDAFFKAYNDAFQRVAFDSEAERTGNPTVRRKKVTFAELNKAAGTVPVTIKTKSGVKIDAYAIFGGTGYVSAERWRDNEDMYSMSGMATGDSGIRFVYAGEAAKIPQGYMNQLVNPKTAKQIFLGDFFFSKDANRYVSKEAQAMFEAYREQIDVQHGQQVNIPALELTPVFVKGSEAYKKYLDANKRFVSEPWFGDAAERSRGGRFSAKRNMVLVDNLGSVIVHPDANNKQIAAGINEALVRNVQLREHWEKPATRGSLEFTANIEDASKDISRHTQLFRIGSGRLRSLILDVVKNKMRDSRVLGNKGRGSWFEQNFDTLADRITDALTEVFRNSYEHFSSEVEANAFASSFIDRKRLKAAREQGKAANIPTDMQFINAEMLDSIGAMREWQDSGLVDAKGSKVPSVEQSRRVIDFYKSVVAQAVESVLHGSGHDRDAERKWFTSDFGEAADKMFREFVSRKIEADRRAYAEYRDASGTGYESSGEAVRTVHTDLDSIGSANDPMVRLVVDFLRSEGVEALAMLNDGKSEYFKELDRLAREDSGKDATDADIVNNKMSAIRTAMSLYSIEGERSLREENRRLGRMVDRAQARRLRMSAIHNAKGMTRAEVDARLGVDSIASLASLPEGGERDLATLIETNALAYIKNSRDEFKSQSPQDFLKNPIAIAEFGATVASWLGNAARTLSFGQTRENAKRDIARIRRYTERPNLETIRGILKQNIAAIAYQHRKHRVSDIIDRIDACIDKNAMGRQSVVVDKELYKRKVEPRIQQYWKDVKDVMRLDPENVADEMKVIGEKYGDFSEALADIADGKGSEGIVPTEETLLARDLAQLRYVALHRYGGLAHKMLGEVSDAIDTVAADIELAQRRVETMVGPKLEMFENNCNALIKGCIDFRRGEKDGKYELSKVGKSLRSALYFNSPDLFRKLKMYFKEGSEAHEVCEELRRDVSIAHIEMERVIAGFETAMRDELPAIFESKYGKLSFEKLAGILHEKVEEYEEFSRTGWRIPTKGGDVVDFNTGRVYEADVAKYTVDVNDADGKTIHKAGDKVASTVKLGADGRLLDATGNEIAKTVHKKGDAIIEKITLAVGMDDPRHDGSGHNSRLSLADLIYIYAARRQGDMRKNNAIYGCDEAYMRRLEEAIGPEGIAVADWMVEKYEEIRKQLSVVSERITGMPVMSPDVQYIPLRFEGEPSVNGTTRYKIDAFPSFLSRRTNHDTSVLREGSGIFDVFSKRVAESAHYMAFSDVIERVKATFCDRKVEGAYRELLGDSAFKQMYRQLFETLSGGVRELDGFFGRLRNFTTAITLFLNVPSAVKQFEGIAAYSSVMGVGHWLGNLHHMGKAYGLLSESSRLKSEEFKRALRDVGDPFTTRKSEGYSDIILALKEATEKAENKGNTVASNPATRFYMRNGLVLTTKIDSLASASMGCAFFNQRLAHHMKKGMTVEEARRAAIADLDYAIQETQQSSRREFMLDPQSGTGRWGVGGRLLTQFAGPAFIRFGMELEALHRAVYVDKNPKAWKDLVNKVIALHVVCPTALSLLGLGAQSIVHKADDEEWAARAVRDWCVSMCLGPLSGWFIVGSALNYTTQTVANGFLEEDVRVSQLRSGNPMMSKVFDLTQRTAKIARDVIDGMRDGDMDTEKVAEEVGNIVDGLFPVLRISKRAYRNFAD